MHATMPEIPGIGEEFGPSPSLKPYYYVSMVLILTVAVLIWYIPLALFADVIVAIGIGIPILIFVTIWTIWIPLYYRTIVYRLTDDEITWRRGVWFRHTGIVPYARITNVDIVQGPVMRRFGISSLKIQTAGYSAQAQAELRLEGMTEPEELRELIMGYVRGSKAAGDATGAETAFPAVPGDTDREMLAELRRIREILEKQGER
jgi:membrane protein YdbS with pleckstrin-like domain